ncbi:MAG: CopG family transcriptional regulator [Thermomicrobiales bacterium]
MIRKQIYLTPKLDRKAKAIAAARGWTESEVIRDALGRLPDPSGSVVEQLAAAGLIEPQTDDTDVPTAAELRVLEAELDEWLESRTTPLRLAEAVIEDRAGR